MNLKIKKTDLKGPIQVGHGWLVANAWAVRTGTDKRLIDKATLDAAFAKLDVAPLAKTQADYLSAHAKVPIMKDGWHRTNVLLEGEDGTLCRVYRDMVTEGNPSICVNETYLNILGKPEQLIRSGAVLSCGSGILAPTTDECPDWAWGLG